MAGKNVTIGNVNISMSANAAQLIRQVTEAEKTYKKKLKTMHKATKDFAASMKNTASVAASFSKSVGMVGGGAAASMGLLAYQAYEAQREMQRMSDIAGLSLDKFTQMTHVTRSLGLQTEYLSDGMKDLSVRIVDAAKGGGSMVDFFALMGENAKEWIDLKPEEQLDRFIELSSKLSDNEAKFWADEVNDSMYRLAVTLRRSGRSVQEFMQEAEELGAGTSSLFIQQINEMYNSAARLSIIFGEIKNTTFGVLAESFGAAFDGMTNKLKEFANQGESTGEGIFNLSKDIALYILNALDEIYTGINAFMTQTRLLLAKFDESFAIGVLSQEQIKQLDEIEHRIDIIKDAIEDGSNTSLWEQLIGEEQGSPETIKLWEGRLKELVSERDKILAGTSEGTFSKVLSGLIENVEKQTYALAKANAVSQAASSAKSNTSDGGQIKAALEYLNRMNLASEKATDSKLKQIALGREQLDLLEKHYEVLVKQQGSNPVIEENLKRISDARKQLDEEEKRRHKELQDQKVRDAKKAAQDMIEAYKAHVDARADFDAQYNLHKASISDQQVAYEIMRLEQLRQQGIITYQEMQQAALQASQNRINAEIQMEMEKLSTGIGGLAAYFEKSETLAKASFAITQGMKLREVIMAQAQAVAQAWADPSIPWWSKATQALMAAGAVGEQISIIQQAGQFHNGGMIPYDGTYYMEGGEMVIPKDRVGDYIDATEKANSGGGGIVINSNIDIGANLVDEKVMAQALAKQQSTIAALVQREYRKRPTRPR